MDVEEDLMVELVGALTNCLVCGLETATSSQLVQLDEKVAALMGNVEDGSVAANAFRSVRRDIAVRLRPHSASRSMN